MPSEFINDGYDDYLRAYITYNGNRFNYNSVASFNVQYSHTVIVNGGEICYLPGSIIELDYLYVGHDWPATGSLYYEYDIGGVQKTIEHTKGLIDWEIPCTLINMPELKNRVSDLQVSGNIGSTSIQLSQIRFDVSGYGDQSNWNKSDFTLQYTNDGEIMHDVEFIFSINSEKTLIALNPSPIEGLTPATPHVIVFKWKKNELGILEVVTAPD